MIYVGSEKGLADLPFAGCKKKECQPDFGQNHVLDILDVGNNKQCSIIITFINVSAQTF